MIFPEIGGVGSQLWCLSEVEMLLSKNFISCQIVPFLILVIQEEDFSGAFPLSVFVGISGLLDSSVPRLGYMRQKENLGNIILSFLGSQGPLPVCLLSTFQSCLLYYIVPRIFVVVVLSGKNKERYVYYMKLIIH